MSRLTTERLPLAFDTAPRRRLARDEASESSEHTNSVMAGMLELVKTCSAEEWLEYYEKLRNLGTTPAQDDLPVNGTQPGGPKNAIDAGRQSLLEVQYGSFTSAAARAENDARNFQSAARDFAKMYPEARLVEGDNMGPLDSNLLSADMKRRV